MSCCQKNGRGRVLGTELQNTTDHYERRVVIFVGRYSNGVGFLPNDHLDPANGTCEDCREHDYAVIIWIVAQGLMIAVVPVLLSTGPKNSK